MHRFIHRLTFGIVALLLLACTHAYAIPITGHVAGPGQSVPAGMSVKFELYNCGGNYPRVVGSFGIVLQNFTVTPDTSGLLTGSIVPNDIIDCGGVTGTTRYYVTPMLNGVPQIPTACYAVLSTMGVFNLDTATPCTSATPPPPPGGPYDATYNNLNLTGLLSGNNALFSGTVQAHQFLLDFTPTPCASGFMTGLSASFGVLCGSPAAAPVSSVFGRVGNVAKQAGDYACGDITGCQPTLSFSARFAVSGTSVDLGTVGSAATATCPSSVTTDAFGRVTSITSSTCGVTSTQIDVTGSRTFGVTYQNTSGAAMTASGYGTITGGSGDSNITCNAGPSSPSTRIFATTTTATISGEFAGFVCPNIPAGYFYSVTATNLISSSPGSWVESPL